jgi:hypothetical protein
MELSITHATHSALGAERTTSTRGGASALRFLVTFLLMYTRLLANWYGGEQEASSM